MDYIVYVIYSKKFDKIYIGYTSDLPGRLISHNEKGTKGWTIKYRPWTLIHTESCGTKKEAMIREKQLKSSRGRAFIWEKINENSG
jgi:putative endonuclease